MEKTKIDLGKTISKGSLFKFISFNTTKISAILFYILILRFLPPEEAGVLFICLAFLGILQTTTSLGSPTTLMRFVSFYIGKNQEDQVKPVTYFLVKWMFFMILTVWTLSLLFQNQLSQVYSPKLTNMLPIILIILPFIIFYYFFGSLLIGLKQFKKSAITEIILEVSKMLFTGMVIFFIARTAWCTLFAILFSAIIATLLNLFWSLKSLKKFKGGKLRKGTSKKLFKFGLPIYLSSSGNMIASWTDTLFLGLFLTSPIVAAYNAALLIARNISPIFSQPISAVIQPLLSELHGKRSKLFNGLARSAFKWNFYLGFPVLLIILTFPQQIISILFPEYYKYYWLLYFLGPAFFISTISASFKSALIAKGKSEVFAISTTLTIIPNIFLNILLIPVYGIMGAAIATGTAFLLGETIVIFYGTKVVNGGFNREIWKAIFSGALMVIVLSLARGILKTDVIGIILAGLIGTSTYITGLYLLRGFNKIDLIVIKAMKSIITANKRGKW